MISENNPEIQERRWRRIVDINTSWSSKTSCIWVFSLHNPDLSSALCNFYAMSLEEQEGSPEAPEVTDREVLDFIAAMAGGDRLRRTLNSVAARSFQMQARTFAFFIFCRNTPFFWSDRFTSQVWDFNHAIPVANNYSRREPVSESSCCPIRAGVHTWNHWMPNGPMYFLLPLNSTLRGNVLLMIVYWVFAFLVTATVSLFWNRVSRMYGLA